MFTRENPSPRYRELMALYKSAHKEGLPHQGVKPEKTFSGGSLAKVIHQIEDLVKLTNSRSLLDYGCGKAYYHRNGFTLSTGKSFSNMTEYFAVEEIYLYDPAVPEFSNFPDRQFDGVYCIDVLEHCPEDDIPWIVEELFDSARKFVFANVASYPAEKYLSNGENAHCTQRSPEWWQALLSQVSKNHPQKLMAFEITQELQTSAGKKFVMTPISNIR